ncbi:MAG: hypothetical protein JXR63_09160 [Spirochaetales bacterium]|nr:hypothetical protein [Spirochaetales bacterium]
MKKVLLAIAVLFIFSCDIYDSDFFFVYDQLFIESDYSLKYSDGFISVVEEASISMFLFFYPGQERQVYVGELSSNVEFFVSDESVISFDAVTGIVVAKKIGFSFIAAYLSSSPEVMKIILVDVSEVAVFSDANFESGVDSIGIFGFYDGQIPVNRLYHFENLLLRDKDIESMDDLVFFPNLKKLDCALNNLTSLDLSLCPLLEILKCEGNLFTELDLSANSKLRIVIATPMPSLEHCYISQEQSDSSFFGLGVAIEPEIIP